MTAFPLASSPARTHAPAPAGSSNVWRLVATVAMVALGWLSIGVLPALAAVDAEVDSFAVGANPYGIALSADGGTAYVANSVSNTVSVIDTASGAVSYDITVSAAPYGLVLSPDGETLYVTLNGASTVAVLDLSAGLEVSTIAVGSLPHGIAISPDGLTLYTANYGSNTVSIVDVGSESEVGGVGVGSQPYGVVVSPDGSAAYVSTNGDDMVYVLGTVSQSVVNIVAVGPNPTGLAITPDGGTLYVANAGDGTVTRIGTALGTNDGFIAVGSVPVGIAISPDGSTAYVTNNSANTVSVVSVATNTVTNTIAVGTQPYGVVVSPDNGTAYVTNTLDSTVSVLASAVPSAPTAVAASSGETQAFVTWATPASAGVSAITSYTITAYDGVTPVATKIVAPHLTGHTVTGLSNGTSYTFTVTASNASGAGLESGASAAVTPTVGNDVRGQVGVIASPSYSQQVVVTPDGTKAYVTNYNTDTVTVIDTATGTTTSVAVGDSPYGITVSADGAYVYVSNFGSASTVSVIDTATNAVSTIGVGLFPLNMVVSPDGSRLYVANLASNRVSVVDTATSTVVANIPTGAYPGDMAISPDGTTIYMTQRDLFAITVLSTVSNSVVGSLALSAVPDSVEISADGSLLYMGNGDAGTVSTVTTALATEGVPIYVGLNPYEVELSPDGLTLYVSNGGSDSVSVIDLITNTVTRTIAVGDFPVGLAATPDGSRVYVANSGSGTVSVLAAVVPAAPTDLAATSSDAEVGLSWTAPTDDGGSAITDYTVEYKASVSGTWLIYADGVSTGTAVMVGGLVNGTSYDFRVSAVNDTGSGPVSNVDSATPAGVPTAPTDLTATGGDSEVDLAWTAPANDGGSPITDYNIEYKETSSGTWLFFADGVSAGTSATVTGLTNGVSYDFHVVPVNSFGTGPATATAAATPGAVPGVPTGVTLTPADAEVALSWTAPVANGGFAVSDYEIEYKASSSGTWLVFSDGVSIATGATVAGLTNGTPYDFRVSAVNAVGTGAASVPDTATPVAVPSAPTDLIPSAGAAQVALAWTVPVDDGGTALTDYLVEYKESSSGTWLVFADGVSPATSATVTGLTNGTLYDFRVSAVNGAGTGIASDPANATPRTVPGVPTGLTPVAADSAVELSWTAPISDGGSPLTDYLVEYKESTSGTWLAFADGTSTAASASVTGLDNGTSYDFRVSAVNVAGAGAPGTPQSATPMTVPGAPTGLATTPGNTEVALSWTAPTDNGGSALTDYVVQYRATGSGTWLMFADGVSTAQSATVTGLINGTQYDFQISAINSVGTGLAGPQESATPLAVADAPTALTPTAGNTEVALTWSAPESDGGNAITDYVVEYKPASSSTWLVFADGVSPGASATVTGLANGAEYDFRVSASNSAGTGIPSAQASATPFTVPDAPSGLTATPGDGRVDLAWAAPADNGGSPVTDYVIEYRTAGGSWMVFDDGVSILTSATVTGLTNGTAYEFRVSAVNADGVGAATGVVSASATALAATGTEPGNALLLALMLVATGVAALVVRRRFTVR